MLLSILYAIVCLLSDVALLRLRPAITRDLELLVLRHEVRGLRRQAKCPACGSGDRLIVAAVSRCLPRAAWRAFPVRPGTLLR